MQIINVILWFIGVLTILLFLCKFVFLIILAIKHTKNNSCWSIERHQMCSENFENAWFLIPTISIDHCNEYIEVSVKWLKWEYYTNYKLSNEV